MVLDAHEFMSKMEKRIDFTDEDKTLLKSQADWGNKLLLKWQNCFMPT